MNPAKTQIKSVVAEEFGRHIEEMGDKARAQVHGHKGGKDAFILAAQRVGQLAAHIDKDLKEGVIDEYVGEPLKVATYAKRYLKRAVGALDNLATAAEIATHVSEGRAKGLDDATGYINGVFKAEMSKLEAFKALVAEDGRVPDAHPGPSLKAQRQEKPKTKRAPVKKAASKRTKKAKAK